MILTQKFHLDAAKAKEGVWLDYDGARFLLAHYGVANPRFQYALASNFESLSETAADFEAFSSQQALEIALFVDSVLLDWEEVYLSEEDKEPIPYSKEKAVEVLTSFPGLRIGLALLASEQSNYAFKKEAELVKN